MNWYQEVNKLIVLNNNKENLGILNYIDNSDIIKQFYNQQNNIYKIVNYCPSMIAFVKNQTYELAFMAVKKYCLAINYIDKKILDDKLILESIDCSKEKYYYNFQKSQLYYNIIKEKKDFVKDIDKSILTKEITLYAFENFDYWIAHFPKQYLTIDICLLALNKHYENIKYIDSYLQTKKMIELIKDNITSSYFKYINPKFQTIELCLKLINDNPTIILYFRKDLLTTDLLLYSINNNYDVFKYLDDNLKTYEMCKLIAEKYGNIIFIPDKFLTNEIYILALNKNINNIIKIEFEAQTQEMIDIIYNTIKNNNNYCLLYILKYINPKLQTYELAYMFVKKNVYLFKYITKKNHKIELLNYVLSQDFNLIKYVKNPNYLKHIWKIEYIELDECVVCGLDKQYFVSYKCPSNKHFVCLDCKEDKCYYRCNIDNKIKDILYVNMSYKFDFFNNY